MFETTSKTVPVTKEMVKAAYRKVKSNKGSAGVDKQSLEEFQKDLSGNLYALWNRLSSGSYMPKPVRSVSIPKANGKKRILGIPTVSDRIAQQVVKDYLEPRLEAQFQENSYGYRPLKSAHQAVTAVQENVRQYAWVIDMDIKSFFDEVDHELLMKAVERHVPEKWVKMYIKRWLESPAQQADGTLIQKQGMGTPQGGVISPLLANLFLHYVLDKWLTKQYPGIAFVRYADDIVIHCQTEAETKQLLEAVRTRLTECKLRLSEEKYILVRFIKDYKQKQLVYKGYPSFEELSGRASDRQKWEANRLDCYRGSSMHFFRSVIKDKVDAEGFAVYKVVRTINPVPLFKSSNIGLLASGPDNKYRLRFVDSLLQHQDYFDETEQKGIYVLDYRDNFYIMYKKKLDFMADRQSIYKQFGLPNYQASILMFTQQPDIAEIPKDTIWVAYPHLWDFKRVLKKPYAFFDGNGVLTDPMSVSYEGYWAYMRVAELLPVDYEPEQMDK